MKQKLLAVLLIAALTGMMFAGCQTAPEVPEQPQNNVVTENNQSDETTTPTEKVAPSEQPTQEPTSAVAPTIPTETPEFTDAPLATVAPTDISEITEEPVATSTPIPTATPEPTAVPEPTATIAPTATVAPTATPKPTATPRPTPTAIPIPTPAPTPSISQIDGPKPPQISFNVYECGEKGEEVLELVTSLREENQYLTATKIIELLSTEYNYSTEDVLYGVYNSGWSSTCITYAKANIKNGSYSKTGLIKELASFLPYIEEDLIYAVENCEADWNQEAVESLEQSLYGTYSTGSSYRECVMSLKNKYYTEEQIAYALSAVEVDWHEQALKKISVYTETRKSGVSYLELIQRLTESHSFEYEIAKEAADSIKDSIDWNEQATKSAKAFAPYCASRAELLQTLENNGFTTDQAEYALKAIGW